MSERERLARRKVQEEQVVVENAERLQRERRLREAEAKLQKTATELGKLERENILALPDLEFRIPPSVIGKRMSIEEAKRFNAEESQKFLQDCKDEYFPCEANFLAITQYLLRNGISIADSATFREAFQRLRSFGVLQEKPVPEPEPIPTPTLPEAELQKEANTFSGYDPKTGLAKDYTSREVDMMSADEYRRIFRLCGHALPRFSDSRL